VDSGAKFGCDYLAYEKPPGQQHSRFMVLCADANQPLRPLGLVSVSRAVSLFFTNLLPYSYCNPIPFP
jgi:tRNA splicing endonuclease